MVCLIENHCGDNSNLFEKGIQGHSWLSLLAPEVIQLFQGLSLLERIRIERIDKSIKANTNLAYLLFDGVSGRLVASARSNPQFPSVESQWHSDTNVKYE